MESAGEPVLGTRLNHSKQNLEVFWGSCFRKWNVFVTIPFLVTYGRKNLRTGRLWVLTGKKKLLPAWFSAKFVILFARSTALANWFACVPVCTSAIAQVSLTSLRLCEFFLSLFGSLTGDAVKIIKKLLALSMTLILRQLQWGAIKH